MVLILACLGILPVLLEVIPTVAIYPILLYIGMLIGSQAFQETPKSHSPAIILSLIPHMAHWGATIIGGALAGAAGIFIGDLKGEALTKVLAGMKGEGVLFEGLHVLGGGSILGGLIFGSVAVFIIERKFHKAAYFAVAGAVLTFFGMMHGDHIGIAHGLSLTVAVSYLMAAGVLYACSYLPASAPAPAHDEHAAAEEHYETAPEGAAHILEADMATTK
jgi:AGZA family xanthine/uracil permease-like MFS transporter